MIRRAALHHAMRGKDQVIFLALPRMQNAGLIPFPEARRDTRAIFTATFTTIARSCARLFDTAVLE
jgi:hypothetical protein